MEPSANINRELSPQPLQGDRFDLLRALTSISSDLRLDNMYLGGITVLDDQNNPDRVAESALSMRELMYHLPDALDVPVIKRMDLGNRGRQIADAFRVMRSNTGSFADGRWRGNVIDNHLQRFLTKMDNFSTEVAEKLPPRQVVIRGMVETRLGGGGQKSEKRRDNRVNVWLRLYDEFNKILHHGVTVTADVQAGLIDDLTLLLLELVRPPITDELSELDDLIAKVQ